MLERIYRYSEHHQIRQRAKCLLLSFQRTPIKELMKIFEVTRKTIYNWFSEWEENKLTDQEEREVLIFDKIKQLIDNEKYSQKPIFNKADRSLEKAKIFA